MAHDYILMNKNTELAKIDISDFGKIDTIKEIYNLKAFPVGIIREDMKKNTYVKSH